jgi:C4-dicarboxylate-specific signal transduction histidine kinase
MTDAVFISDVQGRFIDFNDAFATFHRFNSKDECSKTFAEYPDILDVYMADGTLAPLEMWAVPRALRGETVTNAEYTLRRKDTGETWVGSYSFGPIRDQNGAIVGSVVTGRDITEFKRAEEQIIERTEQLKSANETLCNARVAALNLMEDAVSARKLAEETNEELRREIAVRKRIEEALQKTHAELEAKVEERTAQLREKDQILLQQSRQAAMGEMIGNIAHQWRQPLNSLALLIGMLPAMQEKGELSTRELESLEDKAAGIIQHMSRTIEDFSNYFKPDKEKIIFHAGKAVETTLCLIEDNFRSREIAIEVRSTEDPVIKGYPNEFSQVLLNILINARDAFAESGINNPKVIINMTTENGGAVVTITDNAGGIPEEIINKIFDPYFTTKGPERGTGVGLFMSKGIIEKNMGGRLSARNTGKGAEFRIEV